jgi:hypothetical protein
MTYTFLIWRFGILISPSDIAGHFPILCYFMASAFKFKLSSRELESCKEMK